MPQHADPGGERPWRRAVDFAGPASGAKEFLTAPVVLEELLTALQRLQRTRVNAEGVTVNGTARNETVVIAVAGARGGVGSTSLAVNIGCTLAQDPQNSVALIDLDLALGDADVALDLMPDYTLADVALNIERLDMTFLRRSLSKHSSGLSLLPHPVQMEDVGLIREEHLQRVIGLLRASYTHLVLDLSKGFNLTDVMALRMADAILLVSPAGADQPAQHGPHPVDAGCGSGPGRQGSRRSQSRRLGCRHRAEEGGGHHRSADLLADPQRCPGYDRVAQCRHPPAAARPAQQDPAKHYRSGAALSGRAEAVPAPAKKSRFFSFK